MVRALAIALLLVAPMVGATETQLSANPIRKVVTMLQLMVKEIEAEGKKETEIHEKFMCYCQTTTTELSDSIEDANTKIPQLESSIKEGKETKLKLEGEITQATTDRASAKDTMAQAMAMRTKEGAAFTKEKTTDDANLEALKGALAAIEKGLAGAFLQTNAAQTLRKLSIDDTHMADVDRQMLVSFLSGSQEEDSPGSDEIVGMLKQMQDEMEKDLAEMEATEASAQQNYEEMMAAKKAEVETLTMAIEEKMTRVGELGVEIATMENDLEDTIEDLADDTKMLEDLKKSCAAKAKEFEATSKARKEELLALADTIKMLNSDEALELFKKAIPSASFLQVQESAADVRKRARAVLKASKYRSPELDFIQLYLGGKKAGFEKVIKLIDEMVATLKKEQVQDDEKKEYCETEFDVSEDTKKELDRKIADTSKAIDESKETLETVADEIKALEASIAETDKSVAVATAQRKEENAEFKGMMAANKGAKDLILMAKNRMQKFYNPKLAKFVQLAPSQAPEAEVASFVQVKTQERVKRGDGMPVLFKPPAPPPSAGLFQKKKEAATGVLAMMDMLVADIDKEMRGAEMEEKDAQEDYEGLMADCSTKRSEESKVLTDKEEAKAEAEANLQKLLDANEATGEELRAIMEYIGSLHKECDFLLENYDKRKTARTSEIDAMGKAKAVLNGADYSLLQIGTNVKSLRGMTKA